MEVIRVCIYRTTKHVTQGDHNVVSEKEWCHLHFHRNFTLFFWWFSCPKAKKISEQNAWNTKTYQFFHCRKLAGVQNSWIAFKNRSIHHVQNVQKMDYILLEELVVHILLDHRNLIDLLAPSATWSQLPGNGLATVLKGPYTSRVSTVWLRISVVTEISSQTC